MKAPDQSQTRARLWQALGNQPGVSAWFVVWLLSRRDRPHTEAVRTRYGRLRSGHVKTFSLEPSSCNK